MDSNTAEVIQSKRRPPMWKVKAGKRIKAAFFGQDARALAESYAAENYSEFTVRVKPATDKELRRIAAMTAIPVSQ